MENILKKIQKQTVAGDEVISQNRNAQIKLNKFVLKNERLYKNLKYLQANHLKKCLYLKESHTLFIQPLVFLGLYTDS